MSFFMLVMMVFAPFLLTGQMVNSYPIELKWRGVATECFADDTLVYMSLESGVYEGLIPMYMESYAIYDDEVIVKAQLENVKTQPLAIEERQAVRGLVLDDDFAVEALPLRSRDEALLSVRINPLRQRGDHCEKLLSAILKVTLMPDYSANRSQAVYATHSAMAFGDWYKIGLTETGIYKLTYNDLSDLGLDVAHVDPRQIRVYHNGGGVLPEMNAIARHDDLVEVPIYVAGENDGSFDKSDYILFYGGGPVSWSIDTAKMAYVHKQNPYDDYAYLCGDGLGTR